MSTKTRNSSPFQPDWKVPFGWAIESSSKFVAELNNWRIKCEPCGEWINSSKSALKAHAASDKHMKRSGGNSIWGQMQATADDRNAKKLARQSEMLVCDADLTHCNK